MATNTRLGGVFTTDTDNNLTSTTMVSTENVCGIIFDTKIVGGLTAALGATGDAADNFANGNVVELNTLADAEEAGLKNNSVMHGLPWYHIESFFALAGSSKRLFVSFMDSTSDTTFSAVEKMQVASGGIIYQIGVWTGEAIATVDNGAYTIVASGVISKLQAQAELLGGKVNVTNYEGNAPVNIILNAPIVNAATCDLDKLPDITGLKCPKVSLVIGQAASEAVHDIQLAINTVTSTTTYAPVGNIGAVMAVLSVAPAQESIAYVSNYNVAAVIPEAELGFGDLTVTSATEGEGASAVTTYSWATSVSYTNIKTLGYTKRNTKLHQKGYIFIMNYDGLEGGMFFSSDQTLDAASDYRTIARCRVMHKSRRVVRRALLPYVNSTIELDASTGTLAADDIAKFQNLVLEALDANMVSPVDGRTPQISGRQCTIDENQNVLETDELRIDYRLVPLGLVSGIYVTEGFIRSVSAS